MRIEDIDWVVLSAESAPQQLEQFRRVNAGVNLPFEASPATEGKDVDLRELVEIELLDRENEDWDAASVANALSHWMCWHQAVETQRPVAVLQDDAVLRHDFVARLKTVLEGLPDGWEYLQLGFNLRFGVDLMVTPDCRYRAQFTRRTSVVNDLEIFMDTVSPVVPLRMFNAFGAFAYIITPAAAKLLIDSCFPLRTEVLYVPCLKGRIRTTGIDEVMNRFFGDLQSYASFPPLAMSREEQAPGVVTVVMVEQPESAG